MRGNSLKFSLVIFFSLAVGWALAAPPVGVTPNTGTDTFTYTRIGKADPFRPFIDLELDKKKREEALKKKKAKTMTMLPLLSMPRESFRLVGIAGNNERRMAIVVDPSGRFYPLSPGMVIGENHARIVAIHERSVILEETLSGERPKKRRIEWMLTSPENEVKP